MAANLMCPELAKRQKIITVYNMDSLHLSTYHRSIGTQVQVSCLVPQLYRLQGNKILVCQGNAQWDKPSPRCIRKHKGLSFLRTSTNVPAEPYHFSASSIALVCLASVSILLAILIMACLITNWKQRKSPNDCNTIRRCTRVQSPCSTFDTSDSFRRKHPSSIHIPRATAYTKSKSCFSKHWSDERESYHVYPMNSRYVSAWFDRRLY